jgi:protein Mpv17
MNLLRAYDRALTNKPILTKCITSFCTFSLGDLMCQFFERKYSDRSHYDWSRVVKQGSFGFLVSPYLHTQFTIIMPYLFPASSRLYLVKNIVYDQAIGAPIFLTLFFGYLDFMSNKSLNESIEELKVKVPPTVIDNWKVWPLLMAINFSIVPIPYRVLFSNFCGMFWTVYLSYVQNIKSKILVNDKIEAKI